MRALSPAITSLSPAVPSPLSPTIRSFASRSVSPDRVGSSVPSRFAVEDAVRGRAAAGDVVFAEVAVDRVGAAVALDVVVARRRRPDRRVEIGVVAIDRVDAALAEEESSLASPLIVSLPFVPFVSGAVFAVVATSSSRIDAQDVRLVPARLAPGAVERQPVELGRRGSERAAHAVDGGVVADDDVVVAARDAAVTVAAVQGVVGRRVARVVDAAGRRRRLVVRERPAGAADDVVLALVAGDRVVVGVALEVVVLGVALDRVVAALAVGDVDAVVAVDRVAARGAVRQRREVRDVRRRAGA